MGNAGVKTYIEREYSFLGRISSIRKLAGANINSENFFVETPRGKFVLKHDRVTPRVRLEKIARVLVFCKKKGVRVSTPLQTKNGKYAGRGGFLLFYFVKGKPFSGKNLQRGAAARELAKLHMALAKCPVPFSSQRPYARLYRPLSPKELKKFPLLFQTSRELKKARFPQRGGQLVHGDMQPGNVLFDGNRVALILDFGGMYKENIWREVAFAAFRFTLSRAEGFAPPSKETIRTNVLRFMRVYAHERAVHTPSFEELRLHFMAETFARVSYILRQQKETGRSAWARDLSKQINFLKSV